MNATLRFTRPRVARKAEVLIKVQGEFGMGYLTHISFDGAFIATPMPLERGMKVVLVVDIEGAEQFYKVRAEVLWRNDKTRPVAPDLPPGHELRFIALSEREVAVLHDLLQQLVEVES